jgi:predicted transcriptional regulator YheO
MESEGLTTFLKNLAKSLAAHFGPQCEVAIHDLTLDSENTIIAIENGHVTGRRVGDSASRIVLQALKSKEFSEDKHGYLTRTQEGRLLKSSSIYVRDDSGNVIALVSINYDITDMSRASYILEQFISTTNDKDRKDVDGIDSIHPNVNDLLDSLIEESAAYIGKPVALMNKDDKIKAIRYLEERGAFLVKKSGDKVTKYFDISKYTLYSYLNSEDEE